MLQYTEIVYANEIDFKDGSVACAFDAYVITTCVGKHTVSVNATMLGEDHGDSVVVPRKSVRGLSDLNVLHQEVMAKTLRYDDVVCIDLEYHEPERFVSER